MALQAAGQQTYDYGRQCRGGAVNYENTNTPSVKISVSLRESLGANVCNYRRIVVVHDSTASSFIALR